MTLGQEGRTLMKGDEEPGDAVRETPGDWWVDHTACVACGAPPMVALDLMGFGTNHSDGRYVQCYFKRQPRTPAEVERAGEAAEVSCCGAVGYRGPDEALRARVESGWRASSLDVRRRTGARVIFAVIVSAALILLARFFW